MTPEESFEKNVGDDKLFPNHTDKDIWFSGYTQCQKDMAKISEWQLCPKCFGEGQVSNVGTSSSTYRNCPVCNGNKILIKPYENKQD